MKKAKMALIDWEDFESFVEGHGYDVIKDTKNVYLVVDRQIKEVILKVDIVEKEVV
jgi:hypothetical protein